MAPTEQAIPADDLERTRVALLESENASLRSEITRLRVRLQAADELAECVESLIRWGKDCNFIDCRSYDDQLSDCEQPLANYRAALGETST